MKKLFTKDNLKFYGGTMLGLGILTYTIMTDGIKTGRNMVLDTIIENGGTVVNKDGEIVDIVRWRNSKLF